MHREEHFYIRLLNERSTTVHWVVIGNRWIQVVGTAILGRKNRVYLGRCHEQPRTENDRARRSPADATFHQIRIHRSKPHDDLFGFRLCCATILLGVNRLEHAGDFSHVPKMAEVARLPRKTTMRHADTLLGDRTDPFRHDGLGVRKLHETL